MATIKLAAGHRLKRSLLGKWTLTYRQGRDEWPEAIRTFNPDGTYIWSDLARQPGSQLQTGTFRIVRNRLVAEHDGQCDTFAAKVHRGKLTIKQLKPTVGRLTIYKRS